MYHHYIEAAKFANGQKRSISDPAFNNRKVGIFSLLLEQKILQGKKVHVFKRKRKKISHVTVVKAALSLR